MCIHICIYTYRQTYMYIYIHIASRAAHPDMGQRAGLNGPRWRFATEEKIKVTSRWGCIFHTKDYLWHFIFCRPSWGRVEPSWSHLGLYRGHPVLSYQNIGAILGHLGTQTFPRCRILRKRRAKTSVEGTMPARDVWSVFYIVFSQAWGGVGNSALPRKEEMFSHSHQI